jgi:hypothetical protein
LTPPHQGPSVRRVRRAPRHLAAGHPLSSRPPPRHARRNGTSRTGTASRRWPRGRRRARPASRVRGQQAAAARARHRHLRDERRAPVLPLPEAGRRPTSSCTTCGGARSALKRSETWDREPAEERRRLGRPGGCAGRGGGPARARRAEPGADAPPATVAAETSAGAAPAPVPKTETPPMPARARGTSAAGEIAEPSRREATSLERARECPACHGRHGTAPAPCSTSSPTSGASVYVDDELIGSTDPDGDASCAPASRPDDIVSASPWPDRDLTEDVDLASGRTEVRRRSCPRRRPGSTRDAPAAGPSPVPSRRRRGRPAAGPHRLGLRRPRPRQRPVRGGSGAPRPTPGRSRPFDPSALTPPRRPRREWAAPVSVAARTARVFRRLPPRRAAGPRRHGVGVPGQRGASVRAEDGPCPRSWRSRSSWSASCAKRRSAAPCTTRTSCASSSAARSRASLLHHGAGAGRDAAGPAPRNGAMRPRLATQAVVQIAEALDYAHLKGSCTATSSLRT